MFSTPTMSDRSRGRSFASNALKGTGLVDRDEKMRDVATDKPGGKKTTVKKSGHRPRLIDSYKEGSGGPGPSRSSLHAARAAAVNNALSIRGAAIKTVSIGRGRKNAISLNNPAPTGPVMDIWREFVRKRYNSSVCYLDLERMGDDELLKKNGLVAPGQPGTAEREMAVVFKLASQLKPQVQTISLANNNFSSGSYLSAMSHYLPRLSNLSLQNNRLSTWRELDYISERRSKLKSLRELILTGNPIRELELQNGRAENYRSEVTKRFPSLEVLDMEPVAKISFAVPLASTSSSSGEVSTATEFPLPMAPSFITGVEGSIISKFLSRFFPLFDNQRTALMDVYTPNATFSYSAATSIPARARAQRLNKLKELPNQQKLTWQPWLANDAGGSRNLSRIGGGLEKTVKSLHVGAEDIVKAMSSLPGTRHAVDGASEKFCIDAWPVGEGDGMLLFLSLHGEFAEEPSQGIRSFDRSLILAPAPEGSRARIAGWDVVIMSDQLIVRAYSSHEAWRPGPLKVQTLESSQQPEPQTTQTGSSVGTEAQFHLNAALAAIPEPQRTMVMTICQRTGLNVKFAVDCLEGNGWDIERAVANFEQVKGTLSRDAFI